MPSSTEKIKRYGLQSTLAMRTHTSRSTITEIFNGRRRATVRQAALLEEEFVKRGIPLNRWDLLYGVQKDESLEHYLAAKETRAAEAEGERHGTD